MRTLSFHRCAVRTLLASAPVRPYRLRTVRTLSLRTVRTLVSARCADLLVARRGMHRFAFWPATTAVFRRRSQPFGTAPPRDGRRVRRGHMAPSAGVRARVASRLALTRRPASSCSSDSAAALIRPHRLNACWGEEIGSLRARAARGVCRRSAVGLGWAPRHAHAQPG